MDLREFQHVSSPSPPRLAVYLLCILGGVAGTAAALYQNTLHAAGLILVAPIIEELCKPIGLIILLDKRPGWIRSKWEIVILAVLAAAVFATLENLLYIFVNAPGKGAGFAIFRFTAPTSMHLIATGVFSIGLAKAWKCTMVTAKRFDITMCFRYYLLAAGIHAAYNTVVVILHYAKVLTF